MKGNQSKRKCGRDLVVLYDMGGVRLGDQEERVYHVVNGVKTQAGVDAGVSISAASDYKLSLRSTRNAIQGSVAADE